MNTSSNIELMIKIFFLDWESIVVVVKGHTCQIISGGGNDPTMLSVRKKSAEAFHPN